MNAVLPVVGAMLLTFAPPALAQSIDDAAVDAAIKAGLSGKFSQLVSDCVATAGFGELMASTGVSPTGSFIVVASRAAGRIAIMAEDAKRLYKPFGVADVTPEMRDDSMLFVSVAPITPRSIGDTYHVPSPIENVVLKSKKQPNAVVQPVSSYSQPVEFSNLMGGKIQVNAVVSTFPYEAVRSMPAGEIDIVVITQAGERRCKIGTADRGRILK